jgi:hypothetical protein
MSSVSTAAVNRLLTNFHWMEAVLLSVSKDALEVNWPEITVHNPAGELTYRNSFITDWPVDRNNVEGLTFNLPSVAELAGCGQAPF